MRLVSVTHRGTGHTARVPDAHVPALTRSGWALTGATTNPTPEVEEVAPVTGVDSDVLTESEEDDHHG